MTYQTNRPWSDRFIPTIRTLIGPYVVVVSTDEVDWNEAADLTIFTGALLRGRALTHIAARVRRPGYDEKYPGQFTLRSCSRSGKITELKKIIDGFGDWMFYGHAVDNESAIIGVWHLLDLHVFRAELIRGSMTQPQRFVQGDNWGETPNGDGTKFTWFNITDFGSAFVIASHETTL